MAARRATLKGRDMYGSATEHDVLNVTISSWLEKLSSGALKRWQRRFFECHGRYLKYFDTALGGANRDVKGAIDMHELVEIQENEQGARSVTLVFETGSMMVLRWDGDKDADGRNWMDYFHLMLPANRAAAADGGRISPTSAGSPGRRPRAQSSDLSSAVRTAASSDALRQLQDMRDQDLISEVEHAKMMKDALLHEEEHERKSAEPSAVLAGIHLALRAPSEIQFGPLNVSALVREIQGFKVPYAECAGKDAVILLGQSSMISPTASILDLLCGPPGGGTSSIVRMLSGAGAGAGKTVLCDACGIDRDLGKAVVLSKLLRSHFQRTVKYVFVCQ
jgi:hypothetical protein